MISQIDVYHAPHGPGGGKAQPFFKGIGSKTGLFEARSKYSSRLSLGLCDSHLLRILRVAWVWGRVAWVCHVLHRVAELVIHECLQKMLLTCSQFVINF